MGEEEDWGVIRRKRGRKWCFLGVRERVDRSSFRSRSFRSVSRVCSRYC